MDGIKDTLFKFLRLDNLVENLSGYLEARIELIKIEIREDVAKAIGQTIVLASIALLGILFSLFFSVGLAHYLNMLFDNPYLGYWIIAGVYGLPCLLCVIFRKQIGKAIEKQMMEVIKSKGK